MENVFWELFQQHGISKAKSDAARAEASTISTQSDIYALEAKVDHLALICRAMWSLVREQTSLTEKDLIDRVRELDMEDGTHDKKLKQNVSCYNCGKVISAKEECCIYCGAKSSVGTEFNRL